jgi:hypothetical protein
MHNTLHQQRHLRLHALVVRVERYRRQRAHHTPIRRLLHLGSSLGFRILLPLYPPQLSARCCPN